MFRKSIILIAAIVLFGAFAINLQAAANPNGAGGIMPAYYDHELFTINLKELSDDAAERIIAHNPSLNVIYECDSCPGFIAVIDAIQGDGFNPLWLEVQIEFIGTNPPHQFTSHEEIDEAEEAGEIRLISPGEVYRCSVIGKPHSFTIPPPSGNAPTNIIGETFTFDTDWTVVIDSNNAYHGDFGPPESGYYTYSANLDTALLALFPTNGPANSTLTFIFNSDKKSGTFTLQETLQTGTFVLTP